MSNLIKWNYINLERENRRIIAANRPEKYPFLEPSTDRAENTEKKGFQEGVKAVNYDEILKKEREQIEAEKNRILSEARKEADELIDQARGVAENIKNEAYASGLESGKESGQAEAEEILEQERAKLSEYKEELDSDYQKRLRSMETEIADFMAKLVEKLTGVAAEEKKDIILYLVRCGLEQTGKSSRFLIRVSPEDFSLVEGQKEKLLALLDGQGELSIREDKSFVKNQCVIETDTAVIESSLDIQLANLQEDIRLTALSKEL